MSLAVGALILAGLVLLVGGGEVLVRGASQIAETLGMSRLVVGLTVVSFATSAPEFAVTMQAVVNGSPGLAVGNVVGSNMANVLLVLGVAALVTPLAVRSQVVKMDVPIMIGMSVLVTIFAFSGTIQPWQGLVLFGALIGYVIAAVLVGRRNPDAESAALEPEWTESAGAGDRNPPEQPPSRARVMTVNTLLVAVGVGLLVFGANLLVRGATEIASALGMSDMVIGLTVVAVGTSLPELATAVIAARRGERDLAIGNAVGSNIFNIGAVLGVAALVTPGGIPIPESAAHFDFILMTAVALLLVPIIYTGREISRWEGGLFVAYYIAYTTYLLLNSSGHDALKPFSTVMVVFVVPVTVVVLVSLVWTEQRGRARDRERDEVTRE